MDSDGGAKLFVGGLNWLTTKGSTGFSRLEGLQAYFEKFGQVSDCIVMRDPDGKSRCFGFVTFSDPSVVDAVLEKTHILDKKQVLHARAISRSTPSGLRARVQEAIQRRPQVKLLGHTTRCLLEGFIRRQTKSILLPISSNLEKSRTPL